MRSKNSIIQRWMDRTIGETTPMRRHIILRRGMALVTAWLSWCTFFAVGIWEINGFNPASGTFPPQWASFVLLAALGIGIMAGTSAARLKLGEMFTEIFRAGYEAGRAKENPRDQHQ